MVFFITLFGVSALVAIVGKLLLHGVTWKEMALQIAIQIVVAGIAAVVVYNSNSGDIEIWNGSVTKKEKVSVTCSHTYQCNCRDKRECHWTGTGKSRRRSCSTRRVCDTCRRHSNDWDWLIRNSIGETYTVGRVDGRGSMTPPRWDAVVIGEPTAHIHSYTSYLKAAPGSLFRDKGQKQAKYTKIMPEYPSKIFDIYRLNRLVLVNGATVPDAKQWNARLSEINADLGHARQVNMIIVLARNLPSDFYYALRQHWMGGKKNDVILIIGVDSQNHPKWARVMAWTTDKLVEVKLRDAVIDLPVATSEGVLNALHDNVRQFYKRKPMKDFSYLAASITPTVMQWFITLLISLIVAVGLTILFHKKDIFGDE